MGVGVGVGDTYIYINLPSRSMVALTKAQKRETPMEPKDSMAQ